MASRTLSRRCLPAYHGANELQGHVLVTTVAGPGVGEVVVHVVHLPLAHAFPLPHPWLDAAENDRAARFVFPVDRARYVASHLALRHVLGACLGVASGAVGFAAVPPGEKPRLAPATDLEFNLSQAGALALVAVARGRTLGVDVEEQAAIDRVSLDNQLAPQERAALAALAGDERRRALHRLWVCKEAYLKACGLGLRGLLAGFAVDVVDPPRLVWPAVEAQRWALQVLPVPPGYEAALCHAAQGDPPRVLVREHAWSAIAG
jgi:4'-phosphopantetheinyl transferase